MKKKKSIGLACFGILLLFSLSACLSQKKDTSKVTSSLENSTERDPFEIAGEEELEHKEADPGAEGNSVVGGVVSGYSGDNRTLLYEGKPIVLEYKFECALPCMMGMMIYVNGLLQPYTVFGEETTMYIVQMEENDTKRFTLEFTPVCGKAGEELVIEFANVNNAKVLELKGSANTFGSSHKVFQALPWKLQLNADVPETVYTISDEYETKAFSEEDWEKYIRTDKNGNKRNMLDGICEIEICRDGERLPEKSTFQEKEAEELNVQIYGNLTGKYRVSLYGDFECIPINGYDYVEVVVEKDAYAIIPFSLDLKEVKAKNLFAIAAPMEDENFVAKSSTIYLGRE